MMLDVLSTMAKVTRNGQISLPAELRRRWNVDSVLVMDHGDYAVVCPMPDDPVASVRGKYAGPGPSSEEVRAAEREAEAELEDARLAAHRAVEDRRGAGS